MNPGNLAKYPTRYCSRLSPPVLLIAGMLDAAFWLSTVCRPALQRRGHLNLVNTTGSQTMFVPPNYPYRGRKLMLHDFNLRHMPCISMYHVKSHNMQDSESLAGQVPKSFVTNPLALNPLIADLHHKCPAAGFRVLWVSTQTLRVHVRIYSRLRSQGSSHATTLGPRYIL